MKLAISLITSCGTLLVMWLAGNGDRRAWWVGLANNFAWWTLVVLFGAWGLAPLNTALFFIYIRNLRKGRNGSQGQNQQQFHPS